MLDNSTVDPEWEACRQQYLRDYARLHPAQQAEHASTVLIAIIQALTAPRIIETVGCPLRDHGLQLN